MAYVVFVVRKADTAAAEQAVSVNVILFPWRSPMPMLDLLSLVFVLLCVAALTLGVGVGIYDATH